MCTLKFFGMKNKMKKEKKKKHNKPYQPEVENNLPCL